MSTLINGSINLTILKNLKEQGSDVFWTNKQGDTLVNVSIWVNDQPDQKGNDASITVGKTKEDKKYIGVNLKKYKNGAQSKPESDLPF